MISTSTLRSKGKQIISVLRLSPFDTSTVRGRSQERYRRVVLSTLTSAIAKGISLLTTLISVPLTLHYLGTERYGLWMTISSVTTLLGFADLGIGNGLLNAVAEADGKDSREAAQKSVSSSFYILLAIAGVILVAFFSLYSFIPWPRLFNVSTELAASESGPAIAVFVTCFAISIPFGTVQRVQMGYQEGFVSNLWQSAGNLLGLVGVLVGVYLRAGLPWLVLAMTGGPLLATLFNWLDQFLRARPWLMPRMGYFEWTSARKIAGIGAVFLLLQVMTLITGASDNLVIAQVLGNSAVAGYAVVQKMFSIAALSQIFIVPLWPAFGEAMARSDYAWARRTLKRALLVSLGLSAVVALPMFLFGKPIIAVWVGTDMVPSTALLAGFTLWTLMGCYGGVMSTFLNSGPWVRRQAIFYSVAGISALVLKVVLAHTWQVAGVVWASVIAFSLFYVVPAWLLAQSILRERDHHSAVAITQGDNTQ